jgi:hypothetical protein
LTYPSTSPHAIAKEVEMMRHKIAQLPLNMLYQVSKEPSPLYFVDLEVQENKEICKVNRVQNMQVTIEPPQKESDSTM